MSISKNANQKEGIKSKKRGGGGKYHRSKIVQARLNPKWRFIAGLMAKHQGCTLSHFIEQLVRQIAEEYELAVLSSRKAQTDAYLFAARHSTKMTARAVGDCLWSPNAGERFVMTALYLPDLLSADEYRLWRWIAETSCFWQHFAIVIEDSKTGRVIGTDLWRMVDQYSLRRDRLNAYWPQIEAVKEGWATMASLEALSFPLLLEEDILSEPPPDYPYPVKKIVPCVPSVSAKKEKINHQKEKTTP